MIGVLDFGVELVRILQEPPPFARGGGDGQIKFVQLQPHVGGDDLADGAGVFPGGTNAREDGVRILRVERQEVNDVLLRGLAQLQVHSI